MTLAQASALPPLNPLGGNARGVWLLGYLDRQEGTIRMTGACWVANWDDGRQRMTGGQGLLVSAVLTSH